MHQTHVENPGSGFGLWSLHLPSLVGTTRVSVAFRSRRGRGKYHHLVASLCGCWRLCSILGSAAFLAGETLRFLCRISVATVACPGVCRQPCPPPAALGVHASPYIRLIPLIYCELARLSSHLITSRCVASPSVGSPSRYLHNHVVWRFYNRHHFPIPTHQSNI